MKGSFGGGGRWVFLLCWVFRKEKEKNSKRKKTRNRRVEDREESLRTRRACWISSIDGEFLSFSVYW